MKICKCGVEIPYQVKVDGHPRPLKNRASCLSCVPFGTSPYTKSKDTPEERKRKNAAKQKRHYHKIVEESGIGFAHFMRKSRKNVLVQRLGGSCMACSYDRCLRNLVFHHESGKEFDLSQRSFQFSWEKLLPEVRKCVLLCANCHGEVHDEIRSVDGMSQKTRDLLEGWTPEENSQLRANHPWVRDRMSSTAKTV